MSNFSFLDDGWADVGKLGKKAEDILYQDPTAALQHLRKFGEKLAKIVLKDADLVEPERCSQLNRLLLLKNRQIIPTDIEKRFHNIRMSGNVAGHEDVGTIGEAIAQLESAYLIAAWVYKTYDVASFSPDPFEIPGKKEPIGTHEQISEIIEQKFRDFQRQTEITKVQGKGSAISPRVKINIAKQEKNEDTAIEITSPRDILPNLVEADRFIGKGMDFNCVGIDGCKDGWVAVNITEKSFEFGIINSIDQICSKYDGGSTIIVDMPIGLPQEPNDIRPDDAARGHLPGRASCIFNTPCRQAVYAKTYKEANEINRLIMEKGLSKQSFAICPKIIEVDEFINSHPQYKNKLLESHPELCFAKLNSNKPIIENKKTPDGRRKRIELLNQFYDKTEELIAYALGNRATNEFMVDLVDALCLAVTGMVALKNGYKKVPESPMKDSAGIIMQMVYADNG